MTIHYILCHSDAGKQSAKVVECAKALREAGFEPHILTLDEYAERVKQAREFVEIFTDEANIVTGRSGGKSAFGTIAHDRIGDFFVEPKSPFEKQKRSKGEKKRNRSEWRNNMKGHFK